MQFAGGGIFQRLHKTRRDDVQARYDWTTVTPDACMASYDAASELPRELKLNAQLPARWDEQQLPVTRKFVKILHLEICLYNKLIMDILDHFIYYRNRYDVLHERLERENRERRTTNKAVELQRKRLRDVNTKVRDAVDKVEEKFDEYKAEGHRRRKQYQKKDKAAAEVEKIKQDLILKPKTRSYCEAIYIDLNINPLEDIYNQLMKYGLLKEDGGFDTQGPFMLAQNYVAELCNRTGYVFSEADIRMYFGYIMDEIAGSNVFGDARAIVLELDAVAVYVTMRMIAQEHQLEASYDARDRKRSSEAVDPGFMGRLRLIRGE